MRRAALAFTIVTLAACERPMEPRADANVATGADATADAAGTVVERGRPAPRSTASEAVEPFVGGLDPIEPDDPDLSARVAAAKRCEDFPPVRPPSFRVRIERHALPMKQPESRTGWEVHAIGAKCPLEGRPDENPPCKALSRAALERLYAAIRDASPCTIVEPDPPQRSSPHYGSRYVTITLEGRRVELSDTSTNPLKGDSLDRFGKIVDAVVVEANATP